MKIGRRGNGALGWLDLHRLAESTAQAVERRLSRSLAEARSQAASRTEDETAHLIRHLDRLGQVIESVEAGSRGVRARRRRRPLLNQLRRLEAGGLDRLRALGVERSPVPERADVRVHEIAGTVETAAAGADGRVCDVVLWGYERQGEPVRRACLTVYAYRPRPATKLGQGGARHGETR